MGIFSKVFKHWTKSKNPNSPRFRRDMAEKLAGKYIQYVTENINGVDEVIGRRGSINIREDEIIFYASAEIILRTRIDDMSAWELLSNDGCVVTAPDLNRDGEDRTIVIHYTRLT